MGIFFVIIKLKVGDFMDSYDNDELLMILDDDLFPVEEDVG